jgi:sarcosine oxidase subunit beta
MTKGVSVGSDILVIGAGVIGAAIAKALAERHRSVTVIDANGGPGHGSTSSSASIVRLHATSVDAVVLAAEALPYWQRWQEFLDSPAHEPLARLHTCGSVILDDGSDFLSSVATAMTVAGVEHEWWAHDEMRSQLPLFDLRSFGPPRLPDDARFWDEPRAEIHTAVFTPDSGWVDDPALAAANLLAAAQRAGAVFRPHSTVTGVLSSGDRCLGVTLADGTELRADVVVNAAGPHSTVLNDLAGVTEGMSVRTAALRQELHLVPAPEGLVPGAGRVHVVDGDLGVNFRPETGGGILVGSGGAVCDEPVYVDPDQWDRPIRAEEWDRHVLRLARRIPELRVPNRRTGVTGLYDVTPDWLPIYDRTELPGFYVAIGTSGNQFKTAPLVGELMAELIEQDGSSDVRSDEVALAGPVTGRPIRLAPYSATRTIATGSRG